MRPLFARRLRHVPQSRGFNRWEKLGPAVVLVLVLAVTNKAHAFEAYASRLPCTTDVENEAGLARPCATCHRHPDGGGRCAEGGNCLNSFGVDFQARDNPEADPPLVFPDGFVPHSWSPALAAADSDGDGYTNGEELGDPNGLWFPGAHDVGCACATEPSVTLSTPGAADSDSDGYCCVGQDLNTDGDCLDEGEHNSQLDCDERAAAINSSASELCTNVIDNDCDGYPTLLDTDCAAVVDQDADGRCPIGRDTNGDRDCIDSGEESADRDCDDHQLTVFSGAPEHCGDGRDNDCDGQTDLDDSDCVSNLDSDGDGYCPIGQDLDGDRSCEGSGEALAVYDCDDGDMAINPGSSESCANGIDDDCNGFADADDIACADYYDQDGDGYCGRGRDGNGDGDCADEGEESSAIDCDESAFFVNAGVAEECIGPRTDDDCDGAVNLADSDCAGYLDADGDGFCVEGADSNGDGDCADLGEDVGTDCNESDVAINSGATELCIDGLDNDCDRQVDAADVVDCPGYADEDTDGWCLVGQDLDGDGDCADEGEQGDTHEWSVEEDTSHGVGSEGDPTRYPGAPENCADELDNNLDGVVDESSACSGEVDSDGDGYCALGQDLNADADCLDEGEALSVSDCDDSDPAVHPGAEEACSEIVDRDCDGTWRTEDEDCFYLLDRDGDSICGRGTDMNLDGDCEDADENTAATDCDDSDATISPTRREVCDDGVDNNCDGNIDLADATCYCDVDADCADEDPCTIDTCNSSGICIYDPDAACGDAGVVTDGGVSADGGTTETTGNCGCRVGSQGNDQTSGWLLLCGVAALIFRRRRRNLDGHVRPCQSSR